MYYLGIDTSCYTTSLGVIDDNCNCIYDDRIILSVPLGKKGLRQSESFFQHIHNATSIFKDLSKKITIKNIACIAVSNKPRNMQSSYMPVFTAGLNIAKIIGFSLDIPVFEVSHQENHILAGMWSSKYSFGDKFLAFHISGGTTELLYVENMHPLKIEVVGGTTDLNAGQFIDRIGTTLGFEFPCGKIMDKLSSESKHIFDIPVSVNGCQISFSGPETFVQKVIAKNIYHPADISKSVFLAIAKSIERALFNWSNNGIKDILLIGGVASNTLIRNYLIHSDKLKSKAMNLVFAEVDFSSDNAIGTAIFGKMAFNKNMRDKYGKL